MYKREKLKILMTCRWILKNAGIQKTVNPTAPFSMGSLDISGFEGQKS